MSVHDTIIILETDRELRRDLETDPATLDYRPVPGPFSVVDVSSITSRNPAAVLRDCQFKGIAGAIERGIRVKVNSVLLPGINEHEMIPLSRSLRDMGVAVMNIMPLIPPAEFADLVPVPPVRHLKIREERSTNYPR